MNTYVWVPGGESEDQHAAFRLCFNTRTANTAVTMEHCCVSWYNVFVDGEYVAEGPTRFVGNLPFSACTTLKLPAAGRHVVAIHVHSVGLQTRMLLKTSPVVFCQLTAVDTAAPISEPVWTCHDMSDWYSKRVRLSSLLGWTEQATLLKAQQSWNTVDFDDSDWPPPVPATSKLTFPPLPQELVVGPASSALGSLAQIAAGTLIERHGYREDDVPARFRLRELTTTSGVTHGGATGDGLDFGSPQGVWWRFDAARCQLLRPVLRLRAPAGAIVEVCYCQAKHHCATSPQRQLHVYACKYSRVRPHVKPTPPSPKPLPLKTTHDTVTSTLRLSSH